MVFTTEKKYTEYQFIVENGKIVKIIVQIPNPENETIKEKEYLVNSQTLENAEVRRICYKAFKRLWSVKIYYFCK